MYLLGSQRKDVASGQTFKPPQQISFNPYGLGSLAWKTQVRIPLTYPMELLK